MCIDTVSLPNVSRYDDISIYRCISISDRESLLGANILKKKIYEKVENPTVCTHVLQWLP